MGLINLFLALLFGFGGKNLLFLLRKHFMELYTITFFIIPLIDFTDKRCSISWSLKAAFYTFLLNLETKSAVGEGISKMLLKNLFSPKRAIAAFF